MRVLVVEDEPLLAMLLEENLADLGHELVGSVATVAQALSFLAQSEIDCALLDFSLGHDMNSLPVAQQLQSWGKPFYFLTGHMNLAEEIPMNAPMLTKPVTLDQLQHALEAMEMSGGVSV